MIAKTRKATFGALVILLVGSVPAVSFICEECFTNGNFCIPVGDGGFANCFIDEVDLVCTTFENPNTGELEEVCITEYLCINTEFCGTYDPPPGPCPTV